MTIGSTHSAKPRKWYKIWWDVWIHPGVASFRSLLLEPNHSSTRGYLWVSLIGFVSLILNVPSFLRLMNPAVRPTGLIYYYRCTYILIPVLSVLGLAVSSWIYRLVAKLFGGKGNLNNLTLCLAVVIAPGILIDGIHTLFSYLIYPMPGSIIISGFISIILSIYTMILWIYALKAVEWLETGQAILVFFIPFIVVVLFAICTFLAMLLVLRSSG